MIFFTSSFPPSGYLECDGSNISSSHPELAAIIGSTFGAYGQLPDLRGEFIRGWTHDRTGIPDAGRSFGSWQKHEIQSHDHAMTGRAGGGIVDLYTNKGTFENNSRYNPIQRTDLTGGIETRPRNIALLPCIKY